MQSGEADVRERIIQVLESQQLGVLATQRNGQPYTSLMAFAHTPDLTRIVVATGRATRKHTNLLEQSRVSLLIDTRSNTEKDFHAAAAVTVIGEVVKLSEEEQQTYQSLYLRHHPYLERFVEAPSTTMLLIKVRHYLIVNRFQNVMELHLSDETDIFA